jgi:hypothetical protein
MGDPSRAPWWRIARGLAPCGFLLIAGSFLITEHTAQVFVIRHGKRPRLEG